MTKNRWVVHDVVDPPVEWRASFADGGGAVRRAIARDVLAAADATGVFVVAGADLPARGLRLSGASSNDAWSALMDERGLDDPLPFADALFDGEGRVEIAVRVGVRRGDAIVDETTTDGGALLGSLEALEPAYARRFAARRPIVAPWSDVEGGRFVVHVGFWSDLFWLRDDDALRARNEPRLVDFRERLKAIALARRGEVDLPVPRVDPRDR